MQRIKRDNDSMLERLMNQKSHVDWIEYNKREKEHKRLLISLSRGQRDK